MKESIFWKLSATFKLMNVADVKPNFAALGRKYGLGYRTVKKCYENDYKGKAKTRNKGSKLDRYRSTIEEKLTIPRITRKGVYEFLISKYSFDEVGSYSNFKAYCVKKAHYKKYYEKIIIIILMIHRFMDKIYFVPFLYNLLRKNRVNSSDFKMKYVVIKK